MKSQKDGFGYNERLFSGGMRTRFHLARFGWVQATITKLGINPEKVIELGCYDGKLLSFLSRKPTKYLGLDANWERGLDIARYKWKSEKNYRFIEIRKPDDFEVDEKFDLAVSMETLEHIPPYLVDAYLAMIAAATHGYFLVTIPNEKYLPFLVKWVAKTIFSKDSEQYSALELFAATFGKMTLVRRNEHKGFDYSALVRQISQHFDVVDVSGHPFGFMPTWFCFGIGVVARSKKIAAPKSL